MPISSLITWEIVAYGAGFLLAVALFGLLVIRIVKWVGRAVARLLAIPKAKRRRDAPVIDFDKEARRLLFVAMNFAEAVENDGETAEMNEEMVRATASALEKAFRAGRNAASADPGGAGVTPGNAPEAGGAP